MLGLSRHPLAYSLAFPLISHPVECLVTDHRIYDSYPLERPVHLVLDLAVLGDFARLAFPAKFEPVGVDNAARLPLF